MRGVDVMALWPIAAAFVVSGAALLGSTAILLLGKRAERAAIWFLAFAIGTLTGSAALHLLPEALEIRPAEEVMLLFLGGIVLFITLERVVRWRHTHDHDEQHGHDHLRAPAELILWGDALHNFTDGIVLGVAFSVSPQLGLIATIAVFAHEVPQEIGDFSVLLASGMSRRRALLLNYLASTTVILGTIVAWLWSSAMSATVGWLLPIAAGGFVYIALADLVPSLHHRRGRWAAVGQIALIILGVAVIYFAGELSSHH
jgi:zinc and cadmium transporter